MSDCKDCCIISVPVGPKSGLQYKIGVEEGINLIRKNRGSVMGYYPSDAVVSASIPLASGETWMSLSNPSAILVSTDHPVQVTLFSDTISQVLNVNSVLLVDDVYTSFSIQNALVGAPVANVAVFYIQVEQ